MKCFSPDQVTLGFIGMGAMGSRLARRLLDHGYQVSVYDRTLSKAEALLPNRASVAASISGLAANADVVLSCLTDDRAVRSVYAEPEGVFAGVRQGTVVLEMSTISPEMSRELHALGADRGVDVMDVALSGSTSAVEQGTLTLFVGAGAELFQAAEPIFRTLATRYFLMGPSGSGTSMKLVVNALLGVGMQAIAEAVALGETAGLDRKRFLEVLAQTAVVAPAHVGKLARVEREDYSPQFAIGLMNKDFRLILEAAKLSNLPMPATTGSQDRKGRRAGISQRKPMNREPYLLPNGRVLRYSFRERLVHWMAGVSYVYLLVTGLAFWSPWLFWIAVVLGGATIARELHPWFGLVFIVAVSLMYSMWSRQMKETPADTNWWASIGHYIRNEDEQMPSADRFNPGQKLLFWGFFWNGIFLLLSGLILWLPQYIPWSLRFLRLAAVIVHPVCALLTIAFFIIHVYMGTAMERGAFGSVIRGDVSRAWADKHHHTWYQQLLRDSAERK